MKTVTDPGDASGSPTTFVRNQLEIAVTPGNPHHVATLQDLAQPGLKVVLCAKEVPCGAAAQKALAAGKNTGGAQAFVALVESPEGQQVLADAGFLSA